jgi:glutathione peroxidase-family protein
MTYLIDRKGSVATEYLGLVDKDDIARNIGALLKER